MTSFIKYFITVILIFSSCIKTQAYAQETLKENSVYDSRLPESLEEAELSDQNLLTYIEDSVYNDMIENLNSEEYFIENVNTIYISKEYLEEVAFNSQENIYFGYSLLDLNDAFEGSKYIFTLSEDGQTIVQEFQEYDHTFETITKNVATGSGVILVLVTVSVVGAPLGAPAAFASIIAVSAKAATTVALSSATISSIVAGSITGYQTNDFRAAMKDAALAGSDGFKWGALTGAVFGGSSHYFALNKATNQWLNINQVAQIQKESKYPLSVIKQLQSMEQYNILKQSGITAKILNGKTALIRPIDLNFIDDLGLTNLQRMNKGLAALDPDGTAYQLHHLAQKNDATLAILTQAEHMKGGNYKIWHLLNESSDVIHGTDWQRQTRAFWKAYAKMIESGGIFP